MSDDFNFKDKNVVQNILSKEFNLEYLDIDGAKGDTETIKNYVTISDSLKVCQSKLIIPSKSPICCNKYIDEFDCKENFIDIYYKGDCKYKDGFKSNSNYRQFEFCSR